MSDAGDNSATSDTADDPSGDALDPRLAAWSRRMDPIIMAAAIVPIVAAFARQGNNDPFVLLDVASWLIFLADLVVHLVLRKRYLRTPIGVFDLVIVLLTFPWFLIPGLGNSAVLGLARLGRLLRLVLASGSTSTLRRLSERLGKASLYACLLIFVCSVVVYRVEPPSAGFDTLGDSLWWGVVTFTTVGYGDYVPTTTAGRVVAIFLMMGGIALIGLLAGSLAEFFQSPTPKVEAGSAVGADTPPSAAGSADIDLVLTEVQGLRTELAEVRSLLESDRSEAS